MEKKRQGQHIRFDYPSSDEGTSLPRSVSVAPESVEENANIGWNSSAEEADVEADRDTGETSTPMNSPPSSQEADRVPNKTKQYSFYNANRATETLGKCDNMVFSVIF